MAMGGKILQRTGNVSHRQALTHATVECAKFRTQRDQQPSEVETAYLETVKTMQRKITGKQKT